MVSGEMADNAEQDDYYRGYDGNLARMRLGRACLSFFRSLLKFRLHEAQTLPLARSQQSISSIHIDCYEKIGMFSIFEFLTGNGKANLKDGRSKRQAQFISLQ